MTTKRRTRWIDSLIGQTVVSGSQDVIELFQSAGEVDVDGWTVTRVIGKLWLVSSTLAGAFGAQRLDFGLGMISREAVGAGAFPDPNAEADRPASGWMHRDRCLAFQNGVGTGMFTVCQFDTRSQRIVRGNILHLVINNSTLVGTAFNVSVNGLIRVLVLLP